MLVTRKWHAGETLWRLACNELGSQQTYGEGSAGRGDVDLLAWLDEEESAELAGGEVDLVQDYDPPPEGSDECAAETTPAAAETEGANGLAAAAANPFHEVPVPGRRMPVHCGRGRPRMPVRGRCGHLQRLLARARGPLHVCRWVPRRPEPHPSSPRSPKATVGAGWHQRSTDEPSQSLCVAAASPAVARRTRFSQDAGTMTAIRRARPCSTHARFTAGDD